VHHGEEFVNPAGTPLLAVADGTIVTAGPDAEPACGENSGDSLCGPVPNYYGMLVVLKLDQTYAGKPVFALYGHMSKVGVEVGQHVREGEVLGAVGATGVATGPHVHFEVRVEVNDYAHTRNPALWIKPLAGRGSLAGAVLDRNGNFLRTVNVFLYRDDETQEYVQDTETYGRDSDPKLSPVNSDDLLHENWAMGDLKAGKYLVRAQIGGLNYLRHVTVEDGKLAFVLFGGP
jgi:murein DD-endopeptidase MepM/ murein hydrolase activator NlpD